MLSTCLQILSPETEVFVIIEFYESLAIPREISKYDRFDRRWTTSMFTLPENLLQIVQEFSEDIFYESLDVIPAMDSQIKLRNLREISFK